MARPGKKTPEAWRQEILDAAKELFVSNGYAETSVSDIMNAVGGAKGVFYRYFQSKEALMHALGNQMFFENNPFELVRGRTDLNGLEKIRAVLLLNSGDETRNGINLQAASILKDPQILAAAVEENRRVLTPLWQELLEEGRRDGSIKTEYARELSELLPLVNFWLLPQVFPGAEADVRRKYRFVMEVLACMGLPVFDGALAEYAEKFAAGVSREGREA